MSRLCSAAVAACLIFLLALSGVSGAATAPERGPELQAKSWIVIDARTGEPLAGRAVNRQLAMASTTKMMTAYLAAKNLRFGEMVTAADYKADPAESLMGLVPGQEVSVRDLLYGLMMLSGNDAAVTLAQAVSGSEAEFVQLMNETARDLGLTDTSYQNPVGLDGPRHYTSAADLATLSRLIMEMPRLREISGSLQAKLTSYDPPLTIETTNTFLLENQWAHGIKTGHTLKSGYTLASDGRRKATELIGVLIGANTEAARNAETVRLLDWGFSLYTKRVPIRVDRPVAELPVRFEDQDLAAVSKRRVRLGVREDERLSVTTDLPDEVEGPISKGERIGTATVLLDGESFQTVPLFAGGSIEAPTVVDHLFGSPILIAVVLLVLLSAIIAVVLLMKRHRERTTRKRLQRMVRTRR